VTTEPLLKGLSHVCLGSTDLRKTINFYCGVLGCRVVHEFRNQAGELYGVFLSVNRGTFLEFFNVDKAEPGGGLFRHLCFQVEDIYGFADVLRSKGFPGEIRRGRTDGVLQFWINDPDGNRVEFHQYDEDSVQYSYFDPGIGNRELE
jgi:catechol 2,3-dioxygenase-like lactoylglutathione lyase family enzyme